MQEQAAALNELDGPCALATALLKSAAVRRWVARSYLLVLVDEAQDLDEHRLHILQELSQACRLVAAADGFQCLYDGRDTAYLMGWLEGVGWTHRLTQPHRTRQQGLLAAALAVREGRDLKSVLNQSQQAQNPTWNGQGFRLLQTHASNAGLVAWAIANEMSQRTGQITILTPDARNVLLRAALATVSTRVWNRNNGQTFGPYPHSWDSRDTEEADALLTGITLPEMASCADLRIILTPLAGNPAIAQAISHIDRLRRTWVWRNLARHRSTTLSAKQCATAPVWECDGNTAISP